jgi:hypothetical protein
MRAPLDRTSDDLGIVLVLFLVLVIENTGRKIDYEDEDEDDPNVAHVRFRGAQTSLCRKFFFDGFPGSNV